MATAPPSSKNSTMSWTAVAVVLTALLTLLALLISAAHGAPSPRRPATVSPPRAGPALAVVADLGPDEAAAQARLATTAGVVAGVAYGGMPIGVFGVGVGHTGRTLLYGHVDNVPQPPNLPPRPKPPGDHATGLARRIYNVELAKWKAEKANLCRTWNRARKAKAADWSRTHAGPLLSSRARSHTPITDADVAIVILRVETFFRREGGTPLLVVLGDVPDTPPSTDGIAFRMAGAHVVLTGWTPSAPQAYQTKVTRWKGFFYSLGATEIHVLPRGIDTTRNTVSALRISPPAC
jgi:hypothetical protein